MKPSDSVLFLYQMASQIVEIFSEICFP
jgi:hypothetical protein